MTPCLISLLAEKEFECKKTELYRIYQPTKYNRFFLIWGVRVTIRKIITNLNFPIKSEEEIFSDDNILEEIRGFYISKIL